MKRVLAGLTVLGAVLFCIDIAESASHYSKTVAILQASEITSDCFYFRLEGVAEADPVKPNDPWFAVARTQNGAKEIYATLLAARVSNTGLYQVTTTGQLACGYAQASAVLM